LDVGDFLLVNLARILANLWEVVSLFFFGLFDFTFFSEELINLKTGQIHRKKMSSPNQNIVPYTLPPNNDNNGEGAAVNTTNQLVVRTPSTQKRMLTNYYNLFIFRIFSAFSDFCFGHFYVIKRRQWRHPGNLGNSHFSRKILTKFLRFFWILDFYTNHIFPGFPLFFASLLFSEFFASLSKYPAWVICSHRTLWIVQILFSGREESTWGHTGTVLGSDWWGCSNEVYAQRILP